MNCSYFSNSWQNRRNKKRYFGTRYQVRQGIAKIPNLTAIVSKDNLSVNWDSALSIPRCTWIHREKWYVAECPQLCQRLHWESQKQRCMEWKTGSVCSDLEQTKWEQMPWDWHYLLVHVDMLDWISFKTYQLNFKVRFILGLYN